MDLDFQDLWLEAITEEKGRADPQVPHKFSSTDMAIAMSGLALSSSQGVDAEYVLLACNAASHIHEIELHNVGGFSDRNLTLSFPAFEKCCQHPMLSHIGSNTLNAMRERCPSDVIMTLSFTCLVTPSAKFIRTADAIRLTGTNLEEDRILYVTSDRGRIHYARHFQSEDYKGTLHRLVLNSYENIRRRQNGFIHARCDNVSRSMVLAQFKIGNVIIDTVDNIVTAVKSGVPSQEILWEENGITIFAKDLRDLQGFDYSKDCEGMLDPLVDMLFSAANRDIVGARKGVLPRIKLSQEENCIERRFMDYCKAVVLNHPSRVSKYALMAATLEALIEVSGIESTLYSLCTSSMAAEVSSNEELYGAMHLESLLGLKCSELAGLSQPLTSSGNEQRTRRTRAQVRKACRLVTSNSVERVVKEEELWHDPEILRLQYDSGKLELDLLQISCHVIQLSKLIWHDTEIRMLNLLALGSEMISDELGGEQKSARFYGTTVTANSDEGFTFESDNIVGMQFVNLKALTDHSAVFGAMLSFMQGGPNEGILDVKNPVRCIAERTLFVRNTYKRFQAQGLSRARAIEVAVMVAKVLSIRRTLAYKERVKVDPAVKDALESINGCIAEDSTGLDIVDLIYTGTEEIVEHYGVNSRVLRPVRGENLGGRNFELLDYMENCNLYGKLDVHEDAVAFSACGQKYFAYCQQGRVHVRKRGLREETRRRFGGDKIGLSLFNTGLQIELRTSRPLKSDGEAMDLIMPRAKKDCPLGRWIWSKVMKGRIKYVGTEDSCMWNRYARSPDADVLGQWSVPKWVLRYMLVLRKERVDDNKILVQAGDEMPLFELTDEGRTRYRCRQISSDVRRRDYRKAFFKPRMPAGGSAHPLRLEDSR